MRQGPKLLTQLERAIRARRYSPRTEEAYRGWVRRFVRHHGMRHPEELGLMHVNEFLTHLAVELDVSASTQAPPCNSCIGKCFAVPWTKASAHTELHRASSAGSDPSGCPPC